MDIVGSSFVKRFLTLCFWVLAGLGALNYFTESDWYPRTREVHVAFKASAWVTGELKPCYSSSTPEKGELTFLVCDPNSEEIHSLNVKFWGRIATDRDKIWKCKREESSLTCKLQ